MSQNLEKNRILSALCHGSIFFTPVLVGIAIPIIILVINNDQVVQSNAKESLNFQLNVLIYGVIAGILCLVFIGVFLLLIVLLTSIILPIIAIVKTLDNPNKVYRYPFVFRLL